MTKDEAMATDTLWWREEYTVEDTSRCEECMCYFVLENLLDDGGVVRCLDCINNELRAAELGSPALLELEDKRSDE